MSTTRSPVCEVARWVWPLEAEPSSCLPWRSRWANNQGGIVASAASSVINVEGSQVTPNGGPITVQ